MIVKHSRLRHMKTMPHPTDLPFIKLLDSTKFWRVRLLLCRTYAAPTAPTVLYASTKHPREPEEPSLLSLGAFLRLTIDYCMRIDTVQTSNQP